MDKPLKGIRVTDFTWVVAGPFCTRTLKDMGAEVIKIEARPRPDTMRGYVNHHDDLGDAEPSRLGAFDHFNRDKMAISVNAKHPSGLKLIKDLISVSDIVIENFRGGVLDRWGLGFDEMRKAKPDIIYLSMSGYGHTGPYKDYASHFHIAQAMSGYTAISGYENDIPVVTGAWGDTISGLHASSAITMALEHRNQTGEGQYIDGANMTCISNVMTTAYLQQTINGDAPGPTGNRMPHVNSYLEGAFKCQGEERWVAIGIYSNDEWIKFCNVIGKTELITDPRFSEMDSRSKNWDDLEKEIEDWTINKNVDDVVSLLQKSGIGAALISNVEDLVEHDPQLKHDNFYKSVPHSDPDFDTRVIENTVVKFSGVECTIENASPIIGEHNEYVFQEILGLSPKEYADFKEDGVFF